MTSNNVDEKEIIPIHYNNRNFSPKSGFQRLVLKRESLCFSILSANSISSLESLQRANVFQKTFQTQVALTPYELHAAM